MKAILSHGSGKETKSTIQTTGSWIDIASPSNDELSLLETVAVFVIYMLISCKIVSKKLSPRRKQQRETKQNVFLEYDYTRLSQNTIVSIIYFKSEHIDMKYWALKGIHTKIVGLTYLHATSKSHVVEIWRVFNYRHKKNSSIKKVLRLKCHIDYKGLLSKNKKQTFCLVSLWMNSSILMTICKRWTNFQKIGDDEMKKIKAEMRTKNPASGKHCYLNDGRIVAKTRV